MTKNVPLLEQVQKANDCGGCEITTMGTVWAIARGATHPDDYLLKYSVTELCQALALRGFDVKAMTPDDATILRRIKKFRKQVAKE